MALIIETGQVVEGANSYVSLSDANQYLADRDYDTVLTEGQLLRGADYINSFRTRYKGYKQTNVLSNMQWPRAFAVIDNYLINSNVIPAVIPDAQVEAAYEIAQNRDPHETTSTRPIKREKLDVLEIEYDTQAGRYVPDYEYRKVEALLRPLFKNTGSRLTR